MKNTIFFIITILMVPQVVFADQREKKEASIRLSNEDVEKSTRSNTFRHKSKSSILLSNRNSGSPKLSSSQTMTGKWDGTFKELTAEEIQQMSSQDQAIYELMSRMSPEDRQKTSSVYQEKQTKKSKKGGSETEENLVNGTTASVVQDGVPPDLSPQKAQEQEESFKEPTEEELRQMDLETRTMYELMRRMTPEDRQKMIQKK